MPEEVRTILVQTGLMEAYRLRPPYQRNAYLGLIAHGKRPEARQRRLHQMVEDLRTGDRHMKMAYGARRTDESADRVTGLGALTDHGLTFPNGLY